MHDFITKENETEYRLDKLLECYDMAAQDLDTAIQYHKQARFNLIEWLTSEPIRVTSRSTGLELTRPEIVVRVLKDDTEDLVASKHERTIDE